MTTRLCEEASSVIYSTDLKAKSRLFKGWWGVNDCKNNKNALFVFGDNDISRAKGGQAIIRGCDNAHGIPTKKFPSYANSAYYTDTEYESQVKKIVDKIEDLIIMSESYDAIYFPEDGLGTGLSKLQIKAPKTLEFLNNIIGELFGIQYAK
jgi:hypothetical protein